MATNFNLCENKMIFINKVRMKTFILVEFSDGNHKMITINNSHAEKTKMDIKDVLALGNIDVKSQTMLFEVKDSGIDYLVRINQPLNKAVKAIKGSKKVSTKSLLEKVQVDDPLRNVADQELFEEFGVHISLDDYLSLKSPEPLTGPVIDFLCATKYADSENKKYKVECSYYLNAFIRYIKALTEAAGEKIISSISSELDMIIGKLDITTEKAILMPLCDDFHWTLNVISLKIENANGEKIIEFRHYNSSECTMVNINIVNAVKELIKRKFYGSSTCIIRLTRPSCPRQPNGYDCGVFMLKNIESIMLNKPLLSFNANEALEDRKHFMELVAAKVPQHKKHFLENSEPRHAENLVKGTTTSEIMKRIQQEEAEGKQREEYLKNYQLLDCYKMENDKILNIMKKLRGPVNTIIKTSSVHRWTKVSTLEITTSEVLLEKQIMYVLDNINNLFEEARDEVKYDIILPFVIIQLFMECHGLSKVEAVQRIKTQNEKRALSRDEFSTYC